MIVWDTTYFPPLDVYRIQRHEIQQNDIQHYEQTMTPVL
jgi:hypothetical protein